MPATGTRPRNKRVELEGRSVGVIGLGAIGLRFGGVTSDAYVKMGGVAAASNALTVLSG